MFSRSEPSSFLDPVVLMRADADGPFKALRTSPTRREAQQGQREDDYALHAVRLLLFFSDAASDNPAPSARISTADWSNPDHKIRTERIKHSLSYTEAFSYLTSFYTDKSKSGVASEGYNSGMLACLDLPLYWFIDGRCMLGE